MMADVITKNNNGRYKEEKKRNRRVSDPRVSTINGNQINGHVLVHIITLKKNQKAKNLNHSHKKHVSVLNKYT